MKAQIILQICLAVFFATQSAAQIKLNVAPDFVRDPQISEDRLKEIIASTETALNNYAVVARIYDTKERKVSSESIKAFNDLFNPAAEVVKDFVEFPPRELVDFRDYSIEVYNMLSDKGIQFLLSEAVLTEVRIRPLGNSIYYMPVVKVNKSVYNYLDRYGTVKLSTSGNSMDMLMTFEISGEDLNRVKIAKINHGTSIKPADFYNRIIGIYALGGSSVFTPSFSSHWNTYHANTSMDLTGGINWGLGIDFMTDQFVTSKSQSNRRIGVAAGIRFSSVAMEANIAEYTAAGDAQTVLFNQTELNGIRSVSSGNINQSIRINTFSIPVGIDYKITKTRTFILAVHGRVVPSFNLGASSTIAGTLVHDVYFPEFDLLFSDPKSGSVNWGANADAGSRTFEEETDKDLNSFVLGFELSPTAYMSFGDTRSGWGILVGADLGFVPQSFIVHAPFESAASEPLAASADLPDLTSSYLTDLSSLFFGIRVGLFHRNVTQP